MNNGYELKADLVIAIQTLDTSSFRSILEKAETPYLTLCDHNNSNIFHEIALALVPDPLESEFLDIYLTYFRVFHKEHASELIKTQINHITSTEKYSPAMIAVTFNKLVIFT